jgi:hypothetical protein
MANESAVCRYGYFFNPHTVLENCRIILKSILEKWGWRMWIGFIWHRIGIGGWLL